MEKRFTRSEVPINQTWDLTHIFVDNGSWELELKAVVGDLTTVTQYQGRLGEGPKVLAACLNAMEELTRRFMKVLVYADFQLATDGTNPACQEQAGRVASAQAVLEAGMTFIRTEVLALPDGTVERYIQEDPELGSLKRYLELILKEKPHMLAPETEVTLASLSEVLDAPYMTYQRSKSSDMKFDPIVDGKGDKQEMSFPMYEVAYEKSPDVVLRRNAFASFTKGLQGFKNTYGATWGTEVKKHVVTAKLRKYPSATHMLLKPQDISLEVYHNLHDVIQAELAPHMRRYVNLRKKVLGLDKILYCDIEAPLDPTFKPAITFEEASKLVIDGLSVMGPEYSDIIRTAFKDRWIDWADNVGKSTGAFCGGPYGIHPYVLTTWGNELRGAFTLAHELGHAGHDVMSTRNQRLLNCETVSMFFVEAPSTINELLLADHILSTTSDVRMRRYILMGLLATYYHNFVRHILEAELQRRTYVLAEGGQPLTANVLSKVQGDILKDFWGDVLEIDDGARLTWMRQPHYYMGLYPYSYSAGLTCGTAVAQDIREQGKPAADRWLEVLKAGGTKGPLELMKMAGVDLSKPDPIRKAVAYVGSLVDEVERTM